MLSAYWIYGQGLLSASGGSSSSNQALGGAGSAGRVKLLRLDWADVAYYFDDGMPHGFDV